MLYAAAGMASIFLLYQIISLGWIEDRDRASMLEQLNVVKNAKLKVIKGFSKLPLVDMPVVDKPGQQPLHDIDDRLNNHPSTSVFKCLLSGETIPIENVNDDYCKPKLTVDQVLIVLLIV